jgi:hypothetical protein
MINDYNPFFDKYTNDEGYTLGVDFFNRIKIKNSSNYYDIELKSDLYTKYKRDLMYEIGNRKIYPQYFVEISILNFQYQYFIQKYKCFLSLGGGLGINNKNEPLWGLALYLQGGKDGKGGYHALINNQGEDNLPTGNIEPLFFISPSVIKYISIESENLIKNKPYLELQTGFRLGTKQIGSNIFLNTKLDIPIVQFNYKRNNLFLLSLILQNNLIYHQDGFLLLPEFGSEVQLSFITVGFTSIFIIGNQNVSVEKYDDNETLMRGYIKINF